MKKAIITIVSISVVGIIIFLFSQKDTSRIKETTSPNSNVSTQVPQTKKLPSKSESGKLSTSCNSDLDCEKYLSYNTCEVLCVAKNETNKKIIDNYKKTCDAALWFPGSINCSCIENNCQSTE